MKVSITKRILTGGRNINPDGMSRVYIEIIVYYKDGTRKIRRIPTEVFVNPKYFDKSKDEGYITPKDPDYKDKNNILNGIFFDYGSQLEKRERGTWVKGFDPKTLIPIDDMFPTTTKKLVDYIDDYIRYRKGINTPYNTLKVFTTLKGRIENYEKDQNKTLTFEDINLSFSDSFYSYLLKEYKTGTIEKTYTQFITILTHFFERRDEMNLKISDTFKSKRFRRGKKSENEPKSLSQQEFEILKNHTFKTEHLKLTQKRSLLQISLGVRFSDLFTITPDKINDNCLTYYPSKTRNKTNNKVVVPLNQISKQILQEYDYDTRSLYITNQKYNDGIDDLCKELNKEHPDHFKEVYTSHNFRDTFITFLIESGCDVPSLLRMVGQESYDQLKKYFKSRNEHITERMNNVKVFN